MNASPSRLSPLVRTVLLGISGICLGILAANIVPELLDPLVLQAVFFILGTTVGGTAGFLVGYTARDAEARRFKPAMSGAEKARHQAEREHARQREQEERQRQPEDGRSRPRTRPN